MNPVRTVARDVPPAVGGNARIVRASRTTLRHRQHGGIRDAPSVTYSEGLAVGYRWYDQEKIEPLFPFGHGLSYTHFEYSGLTVASTSTGLEVTFTLRNTGKVRGSEVPQVYLGQERSLVAFTRVELDAGASRKITLSIGRRALSNWSIERHDWVSPKAPLGST